jgi:hypothetical protein
MPVDKGPDDDALATTREGGCGVLTRAPPSDRDFQTKKPAADFSARVLQLFSMMSLCR